MSAGAPPLAPGTHGRPADTSLAPGAHRAPDAPPGRLYKPPEGDGEEEGLELVVGMADAVCADCTRKSPDLVALPDVVALAVGLAVALAVGLARGLAGGLLACRGLTAAVQFACSR